MENRNYFALVLILSCFISFQNLNAQNNSASAPVVHESIQPLLLDKSVLSGLGLEQVELKDTPERKFFQKQLYRGKEISVYVVSSESWVVPFDAFWFDEFIYILNGKAKVKSEEAVHHFESGEYFFAPKGFKGEWEVDCGSNLHYELSVITNRRADSIAVSKEASPKLLNKSILSGSSIEFDKNGLYEENLAEGVELTIKLKAERPREYKIDSPEKEKLICLLSGQLAIQDSDGNEQLFYSGDYIVIPHGFTGLWKSEGHTLVKYISVEKSSN